jgi:hypothetical protein
MVASLDRFTNKGHKNILFMTKWFRLVSPDIKWPGLGLFVRFSNGKNKMAAILFLPFENRTGHFSH